MYDSLLLPWTSASFASVAERSYRAAGLLRTKGTIFLLPPPTSTLRAAYNAPPRPRTRMSSGAVALCKHFERGGASSEHGRPHPYWILPKGSNDQKTAMAEQVLDTMLNEVVWRNVMLLHPGVAVYEIRNPRGFGMRWTLEVKAAENGKNIAEGNTEQDTNGQQDLVVEQEPIKSHNKIDVSIKQPDESKNDIAVEDEPDGEEWTILGTAFRGFVEPIEGMDHELDAG